MSIAAYIEHTNLKPEATPAAIRRLCEEAQTYGFAAVCVNSSYVSLAKAALAGTTVLISSVIGFPLGAMASAAKAQETALAIADGADEIDIVLSIGRAKAGDWDYVEADIRQVVDSASGHPVKVILETGLLTDEEKVKACQAAVASGAAYVKTSTGFGHGGATVADVALMREAVCGQAKIKASGGIRDYETAKALIAAGANRIGASAGITIVAGENNDR